MLLLERRSRSERVQMKTIDLIWPVILLLLTVLLILLSKLV